MSHTKTELNEVAADIDDALAVLDDLVVTVLDLNINADDPADPFNETTRFVRIGNRDVARVASVDPVSRLRSTDLLGVLVVVVQDLITRVEVLESG